MSTGIQISSGIERPVESAGLPANQVNNAVKYSIQSRVKHDALGGMNEPRDI